MSPDPDEFSGYDAWKTRTPEDESPERGCVDCARLNEDLNAISKDLHQSEVKIRALLAAAEKSAEMLNVAIGFAKSEPESPVCPVCGGHKVLCLIHGHRTSPEQP